MARRAMPPPKATGRTAGKTGLPKNMGGSGALTRPVSPGLRTSQRPIPESMGNNSGPPVPKGLRTSRRGIPNTVGGGEPRTAKISDSDRRPNMPRTPARGAAAPPVGGLGRVPNNVRSTSNGGSRYKGG